MIDADAAARVVRGEEFVMPISVAVVGSGPAGMYLVEALQRHGPTSPLIDVIDRLPTPFGLVRSGVAPDHASVRAVTQRFEQAFSRHGVRFLGGVEIGQAVSLDRLRKLYDAVVLACGCPVDKTLDIPGEHLPGVWGSARFTGWYNAHPDHAELEIAELPETVMVIGNGNVAIDVARLLTKPVDALAQTDISPRAMDMLRKSRVRKVVLAGRRSPMDARFSVKELEELGEAADVSLSLPTGTEFPDSTVIASLPAPQASMLNALARFSNSAMSGKARAIELQFLGRPVEIIGRTRVEAMRFERMRMNGNIVEGTRSFFNVRCDVVISCIGYRVKRLAPLNIDERRGSFLHEDGRIEEGLYCTGWARRGPGGTIATNRADAAQIAARISKEVSAIGGEGPSGLDKLLAERGIRPVVFEDWKAIDRAECTRATGGAPRRKFHTVEEMFGICGIDRVSAASA
jgi:NADPH-dependent glutamate synthase beta subunit-like oxidoreductase